MARHRLSPLIAAERRILLGTIERWRWGHRALADQTVTTKAGHLRHGIAETLVKAARAHGLTLSDREIQRRLASARTYRTEPEIRQALADFGGWTGLAEARFPPIEAPAEDGPTGDTDPAGAVDETAEASAADPAPGTGLARQDHIETTRVVDEQGRPVPQQLTLTLPGMDRPVTVPGQLTLAGYRRRLVEQDERLARHAAANGRGWQALARLTAAADGDLSVTVADAADRLQDLGGPPTPPAIPPSP